jgi:hypothetical protein
VLTPVFSGRQLAVSHGTPLLRKNPGNTSYRTALLIQSALLTAVWPVYHSPDVCRRFRAGRQAD